MILFLLLGGMGVNYVQAATYSGSCGTNATWSYNTINNKLTISGSGAMTNYTSSSPAPWDSYKTSILTISIANTITSIGDYAFASCTKAISVSIGTGVKSIGSNAFRGCSLLSSVTIPKGVTTIGDAAFYNCTSFVYVSIPEGVTSLGSQAFYGCTKLTWISIPSSVTTLGSHGLGSCSGITDIYVYWMNTSGNYIPLWPTEFVSTIARPKVTLHVPCGTRSMYKGLTGWMDFKIVEPQYTITAKTNNSSYGTVQIDDGTAGADVSKTVNCATNVTLTAVTTTSNCNIDFLQWNDGNTDNPRTVTAESSITYTAQFGTIGGDCGASGNNLTWSLNRCTGVLTISGSGAMADWSAETDVPWYKYRESITSVVLPVGLTHIGANAFYGCAMTKIDIPAAVRTFGTRAFFSSSLQEICIPEGVTTLPDELFGGHTATTAPLKRIYLPGTLTSMYNIGLAYTRLQTLMIPKSVSDNYIVIHWRYNYIPKTIYASWTENVPRRSGRLESANPNVTKMHVPYGTTSLYTGGSDYYWSRVCGIIEDVDERAIDLGLSIRWASCNIGATAPEENGNFYAWGDTLTRSSFTWGTYPYSGNSTNTMTKYCTRAANGTVDNRSTLLAFDDAAYINWGETWRMPTKDEWNELITQCTWKDTMYNDVPVWQVTGPNGNSIYLPKVGYKNNSSVTAGCYYWSSTLNTANSNDQCNRALYINAANRSSAMYGLRYVGMPVRAVYRREWPSFTLTITDTPEGTPYTKSVNAGSTYTLTAQEDACRPFVRWSDGNTENPRTVTVTEDATYTAVYDGSNYFSGTCGAQGNNVRWTLCDGVLTITGTGEMANWSTNNVPWKNYKTDITSVSIEDGVTSIGTCAFYQLTNLTSVSIGTSVTTIKGDVFAGCTSLTSITFPNSVTSIGQSVCDGCVKLTSVVLPDGLKNIPSYAFQDCFSLTSITIPDGVEIISESAFNYCKALPSVTIPSSVIYIYAEAFRYCSTLEDIYVSWTEAENIPFWPPNMTSNSDITLHVPCAAIDLYQDADGWKDYTITGDETFTITVTTDDASMGSVAIIED